ncbi:MAG: prephenate dehydratase [Actinomycetota bacterium]|nr:prephenate dehydratase [Actinomycetota bacterium]
MRALAPVGAKPVPHPTVRDAIMAVREGAAERAVVPIENSLEGSVAATLDTLAVDAPEVRIFAERTLAIRQSLIAGRPLDLAAIERVVSHPQALAQCARFLRERLPGAEQAGAASTAEGVRQVAAGSAPWAAIGSRLAAEEYGATVLMEGVDDRSDNVTRFVALARAEGADEAPAGAGPAKTSIVFFGFNDVSPGALVAVLQELSSREINLTKIESRPRRVGLGHYMFFADLEGAEGDPHVAEALAALAGRVETLHVLGSYPSAAGDVPPR